MRRLLLAFGVLIASVLATFSTADAAATDCSKYNGGDWGYVFCAGGTGIYFARLKCRHRIGDEFLIYFVYGNYARAKIDVSAGWCPDGFNLVRIRKFNVLD